MQDVSLKSIHDGGSQLILWIRYQWYKFWEGEIWALKKYTKIKPITFAAENWLSTIVYKHEEGTELTGKIQLVVECCKIQILKKKRKWMKDVKTAEES